MKKKKRYKVEIKSKKTGITSFYTANSMKSISQFMQNNYAEYTFGETKENITL